MMKSLKNILKAGALAGFMTLMSSCQKDDLYEIPRFRNVYEKKIAGNLERPSGLSSSSYYQFAKGSKSEDLAVLAQGPLVFIDGNTSMMDLAKSKNTVISQLSGSLDNLTISYLAEFNIKDYFPDFKTPSYSGTNDFLFRPMGLTLDNLVMEDGSVLFSSSSSEKIFKINSSGSIEIYLQSKKLERITDMIKGTDGKVYAVQAPFINYNDSSLIESPKRVISIDKGLINVEFILPSDVNSHPWWTGFPYNRWWTNAPFFEKLKIVENSKLGKEKFGAEFYVSDLLENVIYKVDAKKNVSVLAKGLRYPSSLAVDLSGNIFYTNTPLWTERGPTNIDYPTELCALNPETGQSTLIHKFDEKDMDEYVSSGTAIYVEYNKETYVMPVGFDVSNILYESATKLDFLFTNSHQGTLKLVSVGK